MRLSCCSSPRESLLIRFRSPDIRTRHLELSPDRQTKPTHIQHVRCDRPPWRKTYRVVGFGFTITRFKITRRSEVPDSAIHISGGGPPGGTPVGHHGIVVYSPASGSIVCDSSCVKFLRVSCASTRCFVCFFMVVKPPDSYIGFQEKTFIGSKEPKFMSKNLQIMAIMAICIAFRSSFSTEVRYLSVPRNLEGELFVESA
jgi:hypothetical protein